MVHDLVNAKVFKTIKEADIPILMIKGAVFKIYFNGKVVNKYIRGFTKEKQRMFVQGITLHELYHIVNQVQARDTNLLNFIKSDKKAYKELKEDYPELVKVLEEAKTKIKRK